MNRIHALQADERFLALLNQIEEAEKDRIFCRHGLSHLLDTARIAWIDALEKGLSLDKASVYAAALLHDLGRAPEFGPAADHDTAALEDCRQILSRAGFAPKAAAEILCAVRDHGDKRTPDAMLPPLSAVIRRADGLSRPCWKCAAAEECYWSATRRNGHIII